MKRRFLGATGVSVSDTTLGTMMLGSSGNTDHDESVRMIHTALDAGVNFIDTADVYSKGESEEIVAKALKGHRDEVVLATKFGLPSSDRTDANDRGGSPRYIARAVEASLRRLATDHIDLYQMHRPDPNTDLDETLAALSDLVRAGKVRSIGCSTFEPEIIVDAHWVAETRGYHHFRTEQPRYSIFWRRTEASVLPLAQRYGMGVLTYSPLSSGWLAGRADPTKGHRPSGNWARSFDMTVPENESKLARRPGAGAARRASRNAAHPPRDRLCARPPGGHLCHHRPPHARPARRSSRRLRRGAERGRARPDRRDSPAGERHQSRRQFRRDSRGDQRQAAPPPQLTRVDETFPRRGKSLRPRSPICTPGRKISGGEVGPGELRVGKGREAAP